MAKKKGLKISTITFIVSLSLVAIGFLFYFMNDSGTKIFELGSELIGAGALGTVVALTFKAFGNK